MHEMNLSLRQQPPANLHVETEAAKVIKEASPIQDK
jgi:hypothetical protein